MDFYLEKVGLHELHKVACKVTFTHDGEEAVDLGGPLRRAFDETFKHYFANAGIMDGVRKFLPKPLNIITGNGQVFVGLGRIIAASIVNNGVG